MTDVIEVNAEHPYEVRVGRDAASGLAGLLDGTDRVAVLHPKALRDRVESATAGLSQFVTLIELPDGEQAKTASVLDGCWRLLADQGFTRSDAVVGFGGGATTDLAGFVAATWLRGVRYVAVPTTLLAMVDAAVGGKTGINLPQGKNLVGAFHEPAGVLCDLDLLASLPTDDLRAGMAEIVKAGFIVDGRILELFETDPDAMFDTASDALREVIVRSIQVKADVVSADLREATSVGTAVGRELLNYGHTLGHAIERHEQYQWRHGEAISVGMAFAASLSHRLGYLDEARLARHFAVLDSLGLPTRYNRKAWPELRDAMNLDKKTRGAQLRFVLLDGAGKPFVAVAPDERVMKETFRKLGG